jgi:Cu(I)/Ag(I) efflux system membrane fusion protein
MEGWRSLAPELRKQAEHISHADSLESARGSFELLTDQMTTLLRRFGNPLEDPLQLAYCPMAAGAGAIWIQKGTEIVNPYFGRSMLNCGDLREEVPPRAYLRGPAAASKPSPKAPEGHQH